MGFLDDVKMGYASVAAPHLYAQQIEQAKDKQKSLIAALAARQVPDIMAPIMAHPLNDTHAAMMETLKRALMSPNPELQHAAYGMLASNQDKTFSAISPTDLIKNVNEFERRATASGATLEPGLLTDILLSGITKPQVQISQGARLPTGEEIKMFQTPEGKPLQTIPGETVDDMRRRGGVFAPPVDNTLKDLPEKARAGYVEDAKLLRSLKDTLNAVLETPEAFGPGNMTADKIEAIIPGLGQTALRAQEKYIEGVNDEGALDKRNRVRIAAARDSAASRHDISGTTVTKTENPVLARFIVDPTDTPSIVINKLKDKIDDIEKNQTLFRETYSTGYKPWLNSLPADGATKPKTPRIGEVYMGSKIKKIVQFKDGSTGVELEDGNKRIFK